MDQGYVGFAEVVDGSDERDPGLDGDLLLAPRSFLKLPTTAVVPDAIQPGFVDIHEPPLRLVQLEEDDGTLLPLDQLRHGVRLRSQPDDPLVAQVELLLHDLMHLALLERDRRGGLEVVPDFLHCLDYDASSQLGQDEVAQLLLQVTLGLPLRQQLRQQ